MYCRRCALGIALVAALLFVVVATMPARADLNKDIDWCSGKNNPTQDQVIQGCSGILNTVGNKMPADVRATTYFQRGLAYARKYQWDSALADFNAAIRFQPNMAVAYYNRGLMYLSRSELDLAFADLERAIKLDPKANYQGGLATAYYVRGDKYAADKDYNRAIDDYNEALKRDQNLVEALIGLGVAYTKRSGINFNSGDLDQAIGYFNRAIAIKPNEADAFYNRGLAYTLNYDFDHGFADLDHALKLDPKNIARYNYAVARALVLRASWYVDNKKDDLAIADLERVIKLDPTDEDARKRLVEIKSRLTNVASAAPAPAVPPASAPTAGTTTVASASQDFDGCAKETKDISIAACTHAIESGQYSGLQLAEAYFHRGMVRHLGTQYELAVADFNQAIRLNPREGEYVWGLACTELAMGNKRRGERDLAKAKEFGFSLDKASCAQ